MLENKRYVFYVIKYFLKKWVRLKSLKSLKVGEIEIYNIS